MKETNSINLSIHQEKLVRSLLNTLGHPFPDNIRQIFSLVSPEYYIVQLKKSVDDLRTIAQYYGYDLSQSFDIQLN